MFGLTKPKKVLSDKQLSRAKTSLAILSGILIVQATVVTASYWYDGEEYSSM